MKINLVVEIDGIDKEILRDLMMPESHFTNNKIGSEQRYTSAQTRTIGRDIWF
jgi:hypothetical protein